MLQRPQTADTEIILNLGNSLSAACRGGACIGLRQAQHHHEFGKLNIPFSNPEVGGAGVALSGGAVSTRALDIAGITLGLAISDELIPGSLTRPLP